MKRVVCALLFIFSISAYGQIKYEKGYIITNDGNRSECLIRNLDWKNNPTEFKYKVSEGAEVLTGTISSIKEFGVDNFSKYQRFEVSIDRSSKELNHLSWNRNPEFKTETLFLKVLLEGTASLYYYEESTLKRFFYRTRNSSVQQLVYKQYLVDNSQVASNESYKHQLDTDLKCDDKIKTFISRASYSENDLKRIFTKYNECSGSEVRNFSKGKSKLLVNVTIRPGLNSSSLSIDYLPSPTYDTKFGNQVSFRAAAELELIFPWQKNKWSIFFEPTYRTYKSKANKNSQTFSADYSSVEVPLGFRHYFFLNDRSKIFVDGMYVFDFPFSKSKIKISGVPELIIRSHGNLAFGAGLNIAGKYSAEVRYGLQRDITYEYIQWKTKFQTVSVIFGYTIF